MSGLTREQQAFCRYVASGDTAHEAYCKAFGKTERTDSTRAAASRLGRQPHILAYIEHLKRSEGRAPPLALVGSGNGGEPPLEGEVMGGSGRPMSALELLTREWIIDNLIQNVDMAMGRTDVPVTRVIKGERRNDNGDMTETVDSVTVMVRERDGSTANRALELLDKQLEKLRAEGAANPAAADTAAVVDARVTKLRAAIGLHEKAKEAA